jgi:pyrimidine operon attenuation protein/uracil phosphoribosyltransferase
MIAYTREIEFDYAIIEVHFDILAKKNKEDDLNIMLYGMYIGGVNVTDLLDSRYEEIRSQIIEEVEQEINDNL